MSLKNDISNRTLLNLIKSDNKNAAFSYLKNYIESHSLPLAPERSLHKFIHKIFEDNNRIHKDINRISPEQYESILPDVILSALANTCIHSFCLLTTYQVENILVKTPPLMTKH